MFGKQKPKQIELVELPINAIQIRHESRDQPSLP